MDGFSEDEDEEEEDEEEEDEEGRGLEEEERLKEEEEWSMRSRESSVRKFSLLCDRFGLLTLFELITWSLMSGSLVERGLRSSFLM